MVAVPSSPPPTPPEPGDCCGGGCALCVWDAYDAALAAWQADRPAEPPTAETGH